MSIFIKPNKTFLHFFSTLKAEGSHQCWCVICGRWQWATPPSRQHNIFTFSSAGSSFQQGTEVTALNHQTIDTNVCFTSPDTGAVSSTAS